MKVPLVLSLLIIVNLTDENSISLFKTLINYKFKIFLCIYETVGFLLEQPIYILCPLTKDFLLHWFISIMHFFLCIVLWVSINAQNDVIKIWNSSITLKNALVLLLMVNSFTNFQSLATIKLFSIPPAGLFP